MKLISISVALLALIVARCNSQKITDEKTGRALGAKADGRSGIYYDDMARYLSGLDLPAGSSLVEYTRGPEYAEHRQKMTNFWDRVRSQSIAPISEWRETTMNRNPHGAVCMENRPAIYPFCGADIINLYTICPKASEYIMVALEKAGDLPQPKLQSKEYYLGLKAMRHGMYNIADRNYFFSVHMKADFVKNTEVSGIAPVLMAFAAGLGWHIVDVERIYLSPEGKPVPLDDPNLEFKPRGVRIWFRTADHVQPRSLIYIEQFLSAESVAPAHPLAKFLGQKAGGMMMMKSAGYVIHTAAATAVRDFFMTIPQTIIQDDSGFKYTDIKNGFNISVYGSFDRHPGLTEIPLNDQVQPELTSFYKLKNPPPLAFNFGYGALRKPPKSNILIAHRRQS